MNIYEEHLEKERFIYSIKKCSFTPYWFGFVHQHVFCFICRKNNYIVAKTSILTMWTTLISLFLLIIHFLSADTVESPQARSTE